MTERTKQMIRVGMFVLATGFLGFLLYFFLFSRTPVIVEPDEGSDIAVVDGRLTTSNPVTESNIGPTDGTVAVGAGGSAVVDGGPVLTRRLTSSRIVNPTLTGGDEITYYDPSDGLFYSIDIFGNTVPISNARFVGAEEVNLSAAGESAILEFPDGSNIIYNFETEAQTTLPNHWEDFHFSDGGSIAGKNLGLDPGNRSLVVTAGDGSQAKSIANLGENESQVTINWSPTNEIVAFSETGRAQSAFGRQEIFVIDKLGKAIGTIIVEGSNFAALWSPGGSHILYSISDPRTGDRPGLWFVKAAGNEIGTGRINLKIATWIEKCTFKDSTFVICAVPKDVPAESGIDHRFIETGDDIYQINVTNGRSSLIATPAIETQMFNLKVSDDQTILYYTDEFGRLNSIRLK